VSLESIPISIIGSTHFLMWNTLCYPCCFSFGFVQVLQHRYWVVCCLKVVPSGKWFIHKVEIPIDIRRDVTYIFYLFLCLVSVVVAAVAAFNAIGEGFWLYFGSVLWIRDCRQPLAMNLFMTATSKAQHSYVAGTACLSLLGVILLRNFKIYWSNGNGKLGSS
jgi:protein NrfD